MTGIGGSLKSTALMSANIRPVPVRLVEKEEEREKKKIIDYEDAR